MTNAEPAPDELEPEEKRLWGSHPNGRRHTRSLLTTIAKLRRQVFSLGGKAMGRDYDHRLGFNDGFKAGLEAAAQWLKEQSKFYPTDVFVPPPPCKDGHTHDFDYSAPEQRCTICQRRPGTVDCYGAAMARHICDKWPDTMQEKVKERFEKNKEEIYNEYERTKPV